MSAPALRKIAESLRQIAEAADDETPVDPAAVRHAAVQIEAQAEMIEQDIDNG